MEQKIGVNKGVIAGGGVSHVNNQVGSNNNISTSTHENQGISAEAVAQLLEQLKAALVELPPEHAKEAKVKIAMAEGLVASKDPDLVKDTIPLLSQLATIFNVATTNPAVKAAGAAILAFVGGTPAY